MRISLNKLKYYGEHVATDINLVPDGVDVLVDKIGAQLGAVDSVTPYGNKFDGIIIVKVIECQKHSDADKLSLCKIDDGGAVQSIARDDRGLVQVVCGAPNVHVDMLAAWIPPSVKVPNTLELPEPLIMAVKEIRGQISSGMLASSKELGLGDNHSGILEVDKQVKPGTTFISAYRLEGEQIIDIENKMFTHRPDCFGILGIAREVAGIQGLAFVSPDWYKQQPELPTLAFDEELGLNVKNEVPESVNRFTTVTLSNIKVRPSPVWLQIVLSEAGIRPINNIVDFTNFYMLETGQPLHAYDYDKVKALSEGDKATLIVRNPRPGEKLKLLGGKEIEPVSNDIMIAADKQLIGLGGVMGGSETEVDNNTTKIILECANFDMYAIRRSAMAHGLFTDAVTRFTKGPSPLQNLAILVKIADDICKTTGAQIAGPIIDENNLDESIKKRGSLHPSITATTDFINTRLGLSLSAEDMKKLLENVECRVQINNQELTVTAPFWRTDIELREDVVEEIGRLYGYHNLPLILPKRSLTPSIKNPLLETKAKIRQLLSTEGANEVLTYSFVPGDLMDKTGQDKTKAFQLANALSPQLQYYRISLMPSLLSKVHPNIKAGFDEFALFELGKTHDIDHFDEQGLPNEFEFTAFVVTANDKLNKTGAAYFEVRKYLHTLVSSLSNTAELTFKPISDDMLKYPVLQPYEPKRSALVSIRDGSFLGVAGEFKPNVSRDLKLPKYTAGFEVDTEVLQSLIVSGSKYSPLQKFPSVKQDITLKVPTDKTYEAVSEFVSQQLTSAAPEQTHYQIEAVDIYQKPDDQAYTHFTFRITIAGFNRTLTDQQVAVVLQKIAEAAKSQFKAE
ncbi:MAG TPA: phenylalanine--tRNA ligase subunit beta [Candidatus Saccharimonadales bacterium]|nr:phenylalanine--tRNA ligase subunit beta [Candidatus Saccharimonadales bacterium]